MCSVNWASEVNPHTGLFNRDFASYIYMYVCMYVGMSVCLRLSMGNPYKKSYAKRHGKNYVVQHAHAQGQFWEFETKCPLESLILPSSGRLKQTCDTSIIHLYYILEQL